MTRILTKIHILVAFITISVFLYTGSDMQRHVAPGSTTPLAMRDAMRANHVYIMFSALINLALGLYLVKSQEGWRNALRTLGSTIVIFGSPILIWTYFYEAGAGAAKRPIMMYTIIAMFTAMILHWLSRLAEESDDPQQSPAA
jgi:hypothetical protein